MAIFAHLKPESPLYRIIPEGQLPLRHSIPIRLLEHGLPKCYLAAGYELGKPSVDQLARYLYGLRPEWESIAVAKTRVIDPHGVLILCEHFSHLTFTGRHVHLQKL